jgi:hypothetical protein
MEPYLRKAVQNVAKQLWPEFMKAEESKEEKEREFWIAVYNVPMVHRYPSPLPTVVGANAPLLGCVPTARPPLTGFANSERIRSDHSSP